MLKSHHFRPRLERVVPGGRSTNLLRRLACGAAAIAAVAVLTLPRLALAQYTTRVLDASALHPPAGARVAIVEFSDPECPACATSNPTLMAAVEKYKIPWVRHDFLLPYHIWSPAAAVYAHWFDSQSKALGDDYRNQLFANQRFIYNRLLLRDFTSNFAKSHGIALPFEVDPQHKFMAEAEADTELARRTGIDHTPTIFVVTSGSKGPPYIEVTDLSKLYQIIDEAIADTPEPARKPHRK